MFFPKSMTLTLTIKMHLYRKLFLLMRFLPPAISKYQMMLILIFGNKLVGILAHLQACTSFMLLIFSVYKLCFITTEFQNKKENRFMNEFDLNIFGESDSLSLTQLFRRGRDFIPVTQQISPPIFPNPPASHGNPPACLHWALFHCLISTL